jgi:hypothetical protein
MRSLLQTIESTTNPNDLVRWMRKTKWRLHMDFFTQIAIEEDIFDIHLKEFPLMRGCNNQQGVDR